MYSEVRVNQLFLHVKSFSDYDTHAVRQWRRMEIETASRDTYHQNSLA